MRLHKHRMESGLEQIYQDGDVIIKEGDKGSEMYIIKSGAVSITKETGKGETKLATLSAGDFFGEMALFERTRRSATVRAIGETRVIVLHAGNFLYRIRQDPTFVFEIMAKMSRRIRGLNEELILLLERSEFDAKDLETIFTQVEFKK